MPTFTWSPSAPGYGVGGSNAWILQMDNSMLAPPNTPQWAGGGTGGNGPTDFTLFDTGDLKQRIRNALAASAWHELRMNLQE